MGDNGKLQVLRTLSRPMEFGAPGSEGSWEADLDPAGFSADLERN
jgi:hypothetical protein